MDDDQRSDEELARQVGAGDQDAFAELYRRYFGAVYDFALRLARDRDIAALVVQSTFLRAYQSLLSGGEPAPFKIQLFAGAHHDVAERLRRRRGPMVEGEEAFTVADVSRLPQPVAAADLPDLAHMAWQAARELRLNDYELLDLSIRQRLDTEEIAVVLRTRPETVVSRLTRLDATYEESFSALLLLNRGRRSCLDLDFLVDDDEWSPSLRRRLTRHLQDCQACQATRRDYPRATDVLGALMPVPAPAGWEGTILDRLQNAVRAERVAGEPAPAAPAPAAPAPTVPTTAMAAPPSRGAEPLPEPGYGGEGIGGWFERFFAGGGARGPLLAVFGGGLLALIAVIAALCGMGVFEGGEEATPTASPTVTLTATASGTPTLTMTPTGTASPTQPPPPPPATPTATSAPTATPAVLPSPTSRPTPLPPPTRTLPPITTPTPPPATPTPPPATPGP